MTLNASVSGLIEFLDRDSITYSSENKSPEILEQYNKCCYAESFRSSLVIFPRNVEDIVRVVKFIDRLDPESSPIQVFTVSTGQNWGYGSATPSSNNTVLICLKKLDSEIEWASNEHDVTEPYGKALGIVKVSASVSQQQLYNFLRNEESNFWMDATGSSPNCSVLANTLVRGFGHTAYGDHFEHCAGMEVILADGSLIKTGHAGHVKSANAGVHKHGHGPITEGIFSQSNLGIVTSIYIHLMPKSKHIKKFFIKLNSDDEYIKAAQALRALKLEGVLDSQIHCGNAHKGVQALMRYPFKETNNQTPLPDGVFSKLKKDFDISPWTISGAIYANSKSELKVKSQALKKALNSVEHKLILISPALAKIASKVLNSPLKRVIGKEKQSALVKQVEILKHLIGLKQGIPTDYFINSVYYMKRDQNNNKNPANDGVGLMWLAPIGPNTKETLELMIHTATNISSRHGFDPALSITLLNKRAVDCVISIVFDRRCENENERALTCYDEMIGEFNKLGLPSYRSSIRAMQINELGFDKNLKSLHARLKLSLDPKGIFSPGYYIDAPDNMSGNLTK